MRVMMHAVAVALIWSLLQTVASEELGIQILKYASESVELNCFVLYENKTDNKIEYVWEKKISDPNSEPILSFNKSITQRERFSVYEIQDDQNTTHIVTLKIEDLKSTDSGWYECKVQRENGLTSIKVNLLVSNPPPITQYLVKDLYPAFYQLQNAFDIIWFDFLQKIRRNKKFFVDENQSINNTISEFDFTP